MKKNLIIILFILLCFNNAFAGTGASCDLEVDKAVRSKSNGYVTFEVYNPTDTTMIVTGVKYFDSDSNLWREYSDIYKQVYYKRNETIIHNVNVPMDGWRYIIQCHAKAKRTITPSKKKSGTQKFLDKILGN